MNKFFTKTRKNKQEVPEKASSKIMWSLMYLLLTICVIVASCFIFNKTYYTFFYVEGSSMKPTLNSDLPRGYHHFGIVDSHKSIFKYLKRNDIVITYYQEDYDEDGHLKDYAISKIKRVVGLPNETVNITTKSWLNPKTNKEEPRNFISIVNQETIDGETTFAEAQDLELMFEPNDVDGLTKIMKDDYGSDSFSITLKEDEYFVMGDNWGHSTDSLSKRVGPVHLDYMTGILIAINGYCKVDGNGINARAVDKVYHAPRYFKQ